MAKKTQLQAAAVKIGAALGRADRTARTVGKAVQVAREQLTELTDQVEALAHELKKTRKRLKRAIR